MAHGQEVQIEGQGPVLLTAEVGPEDVYRLAIPAGAVIGDAQRVAEQRIPRRQAHGFLQLGLAVKHRGDFARQFSLSFTFGGVGAVNEFDVIDLLHR